MSFERSKEVLDKTASYNVKDVELIIYHDGKEVFREKRNSSRNDDNGLVNIYSCSKVITCSAALRLYEEGKLSLDDPVSKYIPAFGDIKVKKNGGIYRAEKEMKVWHLFNMCGGFDYREHAPEIVRGIEETEGRCPTLKMMDYYAQVPLNFEPGESWCYSLCHDVIPAIIEVITGKKFGCYVKETIFDPLGMDTATFLLPKEKLDLVIPQYRPLSEYEYNDVGPENVCYQIGTEFESGGAGCVCRPIDYIKFLEGMRTEKVISYETIELMSKNLLDEAKLALCTSPKGYGYGLGVRAPLPESGRTDIGWGGAAGAYPVLDIKNGLSAYYSQHTLGRTVCDRNAMVDAIMLDLGLK